MNADTRKVLISGDTKGNFKALFTRVAAVNKSNGPFHLLLCTGSFFAESETSGESGIAELKDYLSGAKQVPVPTYFLSGSGRGAELALPALEDPESKADIHNLGKAGLRTVQGLSVAFLDQGVGTAEVRELESAVDRAEGDVDFFLTCEWPANVTALCAPGSVPDALDRSGSEAVAELALKVRPRYHIAGGKGAFFARVPYLNKDLGAGSHVTRFIGLAAVGNTDKQKSLHALGLQPAAKMDAAALQQKPAGTTPCPYSIPRKRPMDDNLGEQNWRWQDSKRQKVQPSLGRPGVVKDERKTVYVRNLPYAATEDDIISFFSACGGVADVRRGITDGNMGWGFVQFDTVEAAERATQLTDVNLMGRDLFINAATTRAPELPSGEPVAGCWFCLSSETADLHLVVSIGEEVYVAMDKGPINAQHVLILPIEHRSSSLDLSPAAFTELERYLSALRTCYAAKGMELLAFERYMYFKKKGGNHMQFNVLSIPAAAAKQAASAFEAAAEKLGIPLQQVSGPKTGEAARAALRDAVGSGEFFQVVLPDGSRLAHAISAGSKHPLSFGRDVAAQLAGVPARADWKACQGDSAEEEKITSAFKELFKSYDIMS